MKNPLIEKIKEQLKKPNIQLHNSIQFTILL